MIGMMPQNKKISSLILGEVKMDDGAVAEGVGSEVCAEKVMKTLEAKDPKAFAAAMREMVMVITDELAMEG